MNDPLSNLLLVSLGLFFGGIMIIEGYLIVGMHKQILPLPSKILYWVSVGFAGREKTTQWFAGKNTPQNVKTYAIFALVFGVSLVVSSFIHLNWILS